MWKDNEHQKDILSFLRVSYLGKHLIYKEIETITNLKEIFNENKNGEKNKNFEDIDEFIKLFNESLNIEDLFSKSQ